MLRFTFCRWLLLPLLFAGSLTLRADITSPGAAPSETAPAAPLAPPAESPPAAEPTPAPAPAPAPEPAPAPAPAPTPDPAPPAQPVPLPEPPAAPVPAPVPLPEPPAAPVPAPVPLPEPSVKPAPPPEPIPQPAPPAEPAPIPVAPPEPTPAPITPPPPAESSAGKSVPLPQAPAAEAPVAEAPAPLPAPALKGDARAAFDRALIAYKAGALDDARREFLAIVESGQLSAALAHNLGNVEFRRGQQGQAVLWYRRALALQPASPETLQNLRTVRKQVAFVSFDPFMLSWSHISPAWIKKATILSAWALGLVLVWLIWVTPSRGRRWPLVTLLVLLVPTVSLGVVLTWKTRTDPHPLTKRQVISGESATAFAAPAEASSTIITLPPGSEVLPIETRGNWIYCEIPGGEEDQPLRGWIREPRMEPLWPWPGGLTAR